MKRLEIKDDWRTAKFKLRQKFANFTEDDLQDLDGEDQAAGFFQTRSQTTLSKPRDFKPHKQGRD